MFPRRMNQKKVGWVQLEKKHRGPCAGRFRPCAACRLNDRLRANHINARINRHMSLGWAGDPRYEARRSSGRKLGGQSDFSRAASRRHAFCGGAGKTVLVSPGLSPSWADCVILEHRRRIRLGGRQLYNGGPLPAPCRPRRNRCLGLAPPLPSLGSARPLEMGTPCWLRSIWP